MRTPELPRRAAFLPPLVALALSVLALLPAQSGTAVEDRYDKREYRIPMRDGVHLFTAVYTPVDRSRDWPILMKRTPYGVRPYGEDRCPDFLGPNSLFTDAGYVFVYQDVRGCYMSEGEFVNMTPHQEDKSSPQVTDESSDTHDTIAWLLENVPGHSGRVGMWGISYPGFYAAASMIDAHPALKAVSPQAPIADWWYDDFHHHGAFFLPHAFNFLASFGRKREGPTTERFPRFDHGTPDGYRFFLDLGPLSNANERHFHGEIAFWNAICEHPNYDEFWQARNILPHLQDVAPAVMTVGGWFDAEDLYGPLEIYRRIEADNPGIFNVLVMGPWRHGGWARSAGDQLGNVHFGSATSELYRHEIELPFFEHHLKDAAPHGLPEAYVFETGANRWRRFAKWPPADARGRDLYVHGDGGLSWSAPAAESAHRAFVSDPAVPVPFTEAITTGMTREYMTDDQRFASRRPDVLTWRSEVLAGPVTLAGPIDAELWVSTDQGDADWVVKLIDEFPPHAEDPPTMEPQRHMGGYQMMVRSEVIRGRFRNDPAKPEPFAAGRPTRVPLRLQDVLHTFGPGHRIVVQVQSTWFPLVDRNPQKWVDNIYHATEDDFVPATHKVYADRAHPTRLRVLVLPN